jgi:hypothetical protein
VTQQPPPDQPGGYYQSQYSQQPSYPQQQPSYPQQQPQYPQQPPQYPQQPTYPQQPPPYSPQPQPEYGSQPPYGNQPPPPGYPPGYFPGAGTPPPPKRSKKIPAILGAVGGLVAITIGIAVVRILGSDATNDFDLQSQTPEVGECINQASVSPEANETEVVACDSAEAAWEVIGNDGSWTETAFHDAPEEELCQSFPETEYMLWIGEETEDRSGEGQVVCLSQVTAE